MKVLHLTLKKKWFDMIVSGEKKEEYRELKMYWLNRLIKCDYMCDLENYYPYEMLDEFKRFPDEYLPAVIKHFNARLARFNVVEFRNGYANDAPRIRLEYKGLGIGKGKEEWGGGENCFIIKLGDIV